MSWPEETPDAIVDEFARALVDFLVVHASAARSGAVARDALESELDRLAPLDVWQQDLTPLRRETAGSSGPGGPSADCLGGVPGRRD